MVGYRVCVLSIKFKKGATVNIKCLACAKIVSYKKDYAWSPNALKCPICGDGKNLLVILLRPESAN